MDVWGESSKGRGVQFYNCIMYMLDVSGRIISFFVAWLAGWLNDLELSASSLVTNEKDRSSDVLRSFIYNYSDK